MNDELQSLVDSYLAGTITIPERDRLEGMLRSDEGARRFFVTYADQHASLRWPRRAGGIRAAAPSRRSWLRPVAAAAGILLAVLLFATMRPPRASVTRLAGALWDDRGAPLAAGSAVRPGALEMTEGVAEVTLADGVVLVLEAPARLELSERGAFLRSGRVVARVPQGAIGFTIETGRTSVIDLGTEFGVGVDPAGRTTVQVFEGAVINRPKGGGEERLTAGEAREVGEKSSEALFTPMRFVRELPPPDPGAWHLSYVRSNLERVGVARARKLVTIDGDLRDWDLSERFTARTVAPYGDHFYVDGAMMYDADYLYVAAHVGDPQPMRGMIDPLVDPSAGWKGGGLQLRVSTRSELGWPLRAEQRGLRGRSKDVGTRPEDVSDHLVHLTMWHFRPRAEACLHLAYGMDFHGDTINTLGWDGAYRKDADGRGYTLEYAIPWSLLNRSGPPRPGEELACCWIVNWSDGDGRLWKGQLTEVTNPAERDKHGAEGATYSRAATWGRMLFR